MPEPQTCQECGVELPANAPQGLCPRCLVEMGLSLASAAQPTCVLVEPQIDDRIGHYKLLQQIGEGGCGLVYMAEQEVPVRRRVALKVIKLGMDTKQVIARFEAERQALAMMDHPNIAKVLDAGATETGRPFFVMELVRGIRITDYCDQNNLSTRERLDLFVLVCRAVQHAHQKGIIHRDLKPSNILVTSNDGVPVPKVIDFGIAKATQGRLTDQTLFTAFEQFIGTPAYMSPEQAELNMQDVDTRTDIYSLGALLYELLTGRTPFDAQELLAGGLDWMRRTIRETEPARPSTRLSTMAQGDLSATAKHRHTEALKLVHLLRGDLDWIVMKCLEKDRARRYDTANALAMDIQHYLNCEPVIARPPSRLYEFQKTVRRHKFGFAAAAAVGAALLLGLAVSTRLLFREKAARTQAQAAERSARNEVEKNQFDLQITGDMVAAMIHASPSPSARRELTRVIDRAVERLDASVQGKPDIEAHLRMICGLAYAEVEQFEKAEAMLWKVVELAPKISGEANLDVAASYHRLGIWRVERGDWSGAEAMFRNSVQAAKNVSGGVNGRVMDSLNQLGLTLVRQGNYSGAEAVYREGLAVRRKLPPNDPVVNSGIGGGLVADLADALLAQGRKWEAEQAYREGLKAYAKSQPLDDQNYVRLIRSILRVLREENKLDQVEALCREILAQHRAKATSTGPALVEALSGLAECLVAKGKGEEANAMEREASQKFHNTSLEYEKLASDQSHYPECWSFAISYEAFGWRLAESGHLQSAVQAYRDTQGLWRKLVAGANTEDYRFHLGVSCEALGGLLREAGRPDEALEAARSAQTIWVELVAQFNHEDRRAHLGRTDEAIAALLRAANREDEAAETYRQALGVWERLVADLNKEEYREHLSGTLANLADTLHSQRKDAEAEVLERQTAERGNVPMQNSIAWRWATDPDAKRRNGSNAVLYAEVAVKASNRTNQTYLDTLAAAYAEAGQFTNAVRVQREAIALLRNEEEKRGYGSRLRLYASAMPYRDDAALANRTRELLIAAKFAEAEPLVRECLALRQKQIPDDWRAFNAQSMLGAALLGQRKYSQETESMLLAGYRGMKERESTIPPAGRVRLKEALQRLVQLYEETTRPDQATEWKHKLVDFDAAAK